MTVGYTSQVATCKGFGCFLKLLVRWVFFWVNNWSEDNCVNYTRDECCLEVIRVLHSCSWWFFAIHVTRLDHIEAFSIDKTTSSSQHMFLISFSISQVRLLSQQWKTFPNHFDKEKFIQLDIEYFWTFCRPACTPSISIHDSFSREFPTTRNLLIDIWENTSCMISQLHVKSKKRWRNSRWMRRKWK